MSWRAYSSVLVTRGAVILPRELRQLIDEIYFNGESINLVHTVSPGGLVKTYDVFGDRRIYSPQTFPGWRHMLQYDPASRSWAHPEVEDLGGVLSLTLRGEVRVHVRIEL